MIPRFSQFLRRYSETSRAQDVESLRSLDPRLAEVGSALSGRTFNGGLYRVHSAASSRRSTALVTNAFPAYEGRVLCFAEDWLGRQFSLTPAKTSSDARDADIPSHRGGETGAGDEILLFEPGTAEVLIIPGSMAEFHDVLLTEQAEAALAESFYTTWRSTSGVTKELALEECVGYKIPLFLNGIDDETNVEPSDLDVYWSLMGQLNQATS